MCKVEVDAELLKEAFSLSGYATEREAAEEGLRLYMEWRAFELQWEEMQKPISDDELDDLVAGRWRPGGASAK
jgi:Arc/MetJ family transcription regulator